MLDETTPSTAPRVLLRPDPEFKTQPRLARVRWGLIIPVLLLAGLLTWLALANKPARKARETMVPVTTARVAVREFPVVISALGAAKAWQGVLIRAQVTGRLLRVPVAEGSDVKQGDIVAEIDPAPFQAALLEVQGALAKDQAALAQARLDLGRYQNLAKQNAISAQQLDLQAATVKQDEGIVMTDQGAVNAAKVNLGYTRIAAPVSGRVGMRLVDPGNLVSTTDAGGILSIDQLTPIAVTFTIPEGDFQRLAAASDGFRKPLTAEAYSQETNALLGSGILVVADNHVDASTGTVEMKARFANESRTLWPGQFVNVRLTLETLRQARIMPARAVNQGPDGPFVYVVKDGAAQVQPVTVARVQDGMAVMSQGVKPGDTVVTDGQLALRDGTKVRARAGESAE